MAKWIMQVESRPISAETEKEYHDWYDNIHIPQIVEVAGFNVARRFEPVGEDGAYLAIYEIETEDIDAVKAAISDATKSGRNARPVGVLMDPPPTVRYFKEITAYTP